jgi:beta-phosphoglucomutase-like phosphatase (HAD superfamily)
MMRFHGAIFDIDGVLVDSPHERAWRESLQWLMEGDWRQIAAATRYERDRFTTAMYLNLVAGKPREAGAQAILESFGVPDPDGQRLREYAHAKQARLVELVEGGEFEAFEDGLRFFLAMKHEGALVAAASSSKNANQLLRSVNVGDFCAREGLRYEFVRSATPLFDLFDANVCGLDFIRGKPDPEIFLTAARELQVPPSRCFVVEDAPSGVQAARAAEMACIAVARLGDEASLRAAGADWVVSRLDSLEPAELLAETPATNASSRRNGGLSSLSTAV